LAPNLAAAGLPDTMKGDEESKIHRRITWLNANVFPDRHIDKEALAAVLRLAMPRGLELLKDAEEKAGKITNVSGYLKAAVAREGGVLALPMGGAQGIFTSAAGDSKIQRRATWLNANVFQDRHIDPEAIAAVTSLGAARAMELFKDVEEKQGQVQNPSGYLKAAVKREMGPMAMAPMASVDPQKIQKRAKWLNANVFPDRPIDDEAVAMLSSLGTGRAMELFKDIEEKKEQVRNPSNYLKSATVREASPMAQPMVQGGGEEKIHRRATWLNSNVFADRPIDDEAIQALMTLGTTRAMALYKDVEEKQQQVKSPSGYLKAAVARETDGGSFVAAPPAKVQSVQSGTDETKIHKRVNWLNSNVFSDRIIDDEAIGAMFGLGIGRAFELLKDVEGKAQNLRNPSGYLKAAALREGLVPPKSAREAARPAFASQEDKVSRRARWLNENVFTDRPIDEEAIQAMGSLPMPRAMELFQEVEDKAAQLRNPGGYLKVAVSREGTQARPAIYAQQRQVSQVAGDKLQRRITWLNANVFSHAPLDQETKEAAASVPLERALDILKDVEGKSSTVQNPSGYVKASIKRELTGDTRKRPASTMAGPPAKRRN